MTNNRLIHEKSPYLLQHAHNLVDWYPWGDEAFEKAKTEDKPVFLSIGYSTCHWCHVMAHESFEDDGVAEVLNRCFVSIKVDKEERPDVDSVYMSVCQAFTCSGGWPMSMFLTPDQHPFFAGTYFPKDAFVGLLTKIHEAWQTDREALTHSGEQVVRALSRTSKGGGSLSGAAADVAAEAFAHAFDKTYGGFGHAPKFPTPHNLMFLMAYHERTGDANALKMVETTLTQMYKGGIFDHIGGGFSRYSTDRYFLAPHFEKMLYDNALLMMTYVKAYHLTGNALYKRVAEKTAGYVLRELTHPDGGFYSAQDADSDGVEGKYYVFDYDEIIKLLGAEDGARFCAYFGITKGGNFEDKSIPNLLHADGPDSRFEAFLPKVYDYRKLRTRLHLDDKILTAWNGMMIAAFALMHRITGETGYLDAAGRAMDFIDRNLCDGDKLFVSWRDGKRSGGGFLDDYAYYIFALLHLYDATLDPKYLERAQGLCERAADLFADNENGGFYLYGKDDEQLILRPKDTYDGAVPSGNSVMAYCLVRLAHITEDAGLAAAAERQLQFLAAQANDYPTGHSFYLLALLRFLNPPAHIVCALKDTHAPFPYGADVRVIPGGSDAYPLMNNATTYYVCKDKSCLPPVNRLDDVL